MPPPPHPDLSSPVAPLELELRRGCRDDAVEGGLGAYLVSWARGLVAAAEDDLAARLTRIAAAYETYAALSPPDRQTLCERTLQALALYRKRFASPPPRLTPEADVRFLRHVGPRRAEVLAQLGISTVHDLLRHYPLRYDDRRNCPPIASLAHRQSATVQVRVTGPGHLKRPAGRVVAEVPATDGTTAVTLTWFNQAYRADQYATDTRLLVTGQCMIRKGEHSLIVAEVEVLDPDADAERLSIGRLTPVYPLSAGLSQALLRRLISQALETCDPLPPSPLPEDLTAGRGLVTLAEALREIHFPTDDNARLRARGRLAYEELFLLQATLAQRRAHAVAQTPEAVVEVAGLVAEFLASLPFAATGAQVRVIGDIEADLPVPRPANRLIHGDVGSGKTVCAAFALAAAARQGRQAALMAPTELLAQQHYRTLSTLLQPLGLSCRLLIGAMSGAAGDHARRRIRSGEDRIVVGTHALFQESVQFHDLAVVVIDEQHRFGVRQRAELAAKGLRPNLFVMSATPIPRTLALTAYGDFDVSVLDELPPGRKPVVTALAWGKERRRAYETLGARVAAGRQAYIVCPLIEDGEDDYLAAAEREFHRLRTGHFASLRLGLLHGKLDSERRDATMQRFHAGEIEILVTTTVIEVGVDVPNATVMLVENAERFGLAQLHQLRGRVARGEHEGICMLLTRAATPEVVSRLQVLERTCDGFEVAEEDLRRRGPGELTGARQSGLPDLRMADLVADTRTLVQAREDAFALLAADPALALPEHAALREAIAGFGRQQEKWAL